MRMKTYNEYYNECKEDGKKSVSMSESRYGKHWWQKNSNNVDGINDAPIIKNETNISNSEWITLHNMLSAMVIDYMIENKINENIFSYSINIHLGDKKRKWTIYLRNITNDVISLPDSEPIDIPSYSLISDEKIINEFDWLNRYIYGNINKFIITHNIGNIDNINFSIDDIHSSVVYGKWHPSSDSSLSVYGTKIEPLVVSM